MKTINSFDNATSIVTSSQQASHIFYPLICMIYLTLDLLSYIYVYYIINVHHFILSFSVFFFTTTYMLIDIVVEVYGYKYARRLIWFGLICETLFSCFIYLLSVLHFTVVENNGANTILSQNIMRIFMTSLITTPAGDFVNSFAISRWKIYLQGKYFGLRSIAATMLGLIVYCLLSHTILFFNVLTLKKLFILIGSSILFKFIYISLCAIPSSLCMTYLKNKEKIDQYDYDVNYNPFKIS